MGTQNRSHTYSRRGLLFGGMESKWARHQARLLELREHFLPPDQRGGNTPVEWRPLAEETTVRFDNYDQNLALALLAHERYPLREIDAALQRISEGTYGICERTGAPIDPSRLNALPWARSCNRAERLRRPARFAHH